MEEKIKDLQAENMILREKLCIALDLLEQVNEHNGVEVLTLVSEFINENDPTVGGTLI